MAGGINFRVIMSPLSAAGIRYRKNGFAMNIMSYICRRHHGTTTKENAGTGLSPLRSFPKSLDVIIILCQGHSVERLRLAEFTNPGKVHMEVINLEMVHEVQLHIHLDGAVRHSTLWRAARKKGLCGPANTFPEFVDLIRCSKGDLASFLSSFDRILPIIAGDRELISQIAYEFCEDQAKEGVVYFEARYSPHFMSSSFSAPNSRGKSVIRDDIMTPRDVVIAVNDGIRKGCQEFKVKGRTILCMIRPCPEFSHEVVQLSHEFLNDTVVGVDMAGDEDAPCTTQHIDAFRLAGDLGLHRTVHAGELGPAENVRFAVEQLGAERIGHGYQICQDPNIYKMIRDRFIHMELCPTSSIYTGAWKGKLSEHIAKRFAKDGFNIGINTDDPTLLLNTMESEFQLAKTYFDFTDSQMKNMTLNAARSCFMPEKEKTHLVKELQAKFDLL